MYPQGFLRETYANVRAKAATIHRRDLSKMELIDAVKRWAATAAVPTCANVIMNIAMPHPPNGLTKQRNTDACSWYGNYVVPLPYDT